MKQIDRRQFLKSTVGGIVALVAGPSIAHSQAEFLPHSDVTDKFVRLMTDYGDLFPEHYASTTKDGSTFSAFYVGRTVNLKILKGDEERVFDATDSDGTVNKYFKKDGPVFSVNLLPTNVRAYLQEEYESGLQIVIDQIEREVAEYFGLSQ